MYSLLYSLNTIAASGCWRFNPNICGVFRLSLTSGEKNFSKEAATVSFDLMADEDGQVRE